MYTPDVTGAHILLTYSDIYADDKGDIQYITPREHLFNESQVKKDDFRKTKRLVIK